MSDGAARAFPDRLRLPMRFDPDPLANDLRAFEASDWWAHFVRSNYDGEWTVIPLRGPAGEVHPIRMMYSDPAASVFEDTPMLAQVPAIRGVLAAFHCPLQAVRLMRLAPGSRIKEHQDHDLDAAGGIARLHLPIVTSPEVDFRLNGTTVVMEPGSVWYLRLSDPHSVDNRGSLDRVHLVMDVLTNPWLDALLHRAMEPQR